MFTLILTVLSRDYTRGGTRIPSKDCSYKGEHSKLRVEGLGLFWGLGFREFRV